MSYYRSTKRPRDDEDELPTAQKPRIASQAGRVEDKRSYKINFPVAKWKLLSAKGYVNILKGVEELLWCPALIDEAYRDLHAFLESYDGEAQEAATMHRKLVRVLDDQPRLMSLPETQEQLGIAMQHMRRLRDLTIMPTRHSLYRPKPDRLNVFAFTSTIAAFGYRRETPQTQTQSRSGRSSKGATLGVSLSKLRIVDVDLCALLSCVPCQLPAVSLAQDEFGYAYHLPAGLVSWQAMYLAWCSVACTIRTLQCEFIRSEVFMRRLEQICQRSGILPETQRWRTTAVLAACQQLQSLCLNFAFFSGASQAAQAVPACEGGQSTSASPPARVFLPELDLSYVLPYCDSPDGREDTPQFKHLHSFVLANVILTDSAALLNFIKTHPGLQTLRLQDVGYRYGPSWNEILHAVASSLPHLRKLTLSGLTHVNASANALEYEDTSLYKIVAEALPVRVEFICD
ncbi:hypothetical protein AURDEDRAFT_185726 [Auricularia subglabra TFB-10046 SS5]|nr:hypothetical protein AURDEDRAFT_185726 [Auricularia subglabra TFB-10046 SS5]